jgi:hypothetical protein
MKTIERSNPKSDSSEHSASSAMKWVAGVAATIAATVVSWWLTQGFSQLPTFSKPVPVEFFESRDGQYIARRVGSGKEQQYEISNKLTGVKLFRTRTNDRSENDVKVGDFDSTSSCFVAVYHYSHDGDHTDAVVFALPGGSLVRVVTKPGHTREISDVLRNCRAP